MPLKRLSNQQMDCSESKNQEYTNFRQQLLTNIMVISLLFATLFSLLHDLRINKLNDFHALANYVYACFSLILLIVLRRVPQRFSLILHLFLGASLLTFISALTNVVDDQFRVIWFYLLVMVAYMLGGSVTGLLTTLVSIIAIMTASTLTDLQFNAVTMTSIILGLVIMSMIVHVFAKRAIEYANLVDEKNSQLQLLATVDPLTGIKNVRYYYEVGERLFSTAKRSRQSLAFLYLDIDHFKQFNDRYGHQMGDEVLINVAASIKSIVRKSDVFARIGGEEFCVILPDTDAQGAQILAEKMRHTIATNEINIDGEKLQVTTSIGISMLQDEDESMQQLQNRADKGLYLAKNNGRNRIEFS